MEKDALNAMRPVAPIDYTKDLPCPILGLFGEDDRSPTPEQVAQHEEELKKHGKNYEFHMYPDAGHGFLLLQSTQLSPTAGGRWLGEDIRFLG